MSQDFYEILGVSRDASEDEIQEAYREKAREYHPDVSDDPDAEEKFKQATKAKEVLTDEEKRQMYDQSVTSASSRPRSAAALVVAAAAVGWVETRSVAALAASICRTSSTVLRGRRPRRTRWQPTAAGAGPPDATGNRPRRGLPRRDEATERHPAGSLRRL